MPRDTKTQPKGSMADPGREVAGTGSPDKTIDRIGGGKLTDKGKGK